MEKSSHIRYAALPEGVSKRFSNTYSSVTAGVSGLFKNSQTLARPDVLDITSDEAFQSYKEYNTDTQLRANEKHMWAGIAERVAGAILAGATFALGNNFIIAAEAAGLSTALVGLGALTAIVGVSVGVFYTLRQSATRAQSDKGMDVSDYSIKRESALIAQEIKKAFQEDIAPVQSHSHTKEVMVVKEPANENTAPSTKLAQIASGRELQAKIAQENAQESARS